MAKRRRTLSDTPEERRIYELAAKQEHAFIVDAMKGLLAHKRKPRGWTRTRAGPGRPRRRRPGRQEQHGWRACTTALVVMVHLRRSYREMAALLAGDAWLRRRIGFARAPSHMTLHRAMGRLPPEWVKALAQAVAAKAKGGRRGAPQGPAWPATAPA